MRSSSSGRPAIPSSLTPPCVRRSSELDPGLALSSIATGDELVSDSLAAPRYLSVLIGMFALAALVLSVVGIYGVMAYFVQQHTRDIGIRLALGGEPSDVRRMVVLQGLRLVAAGVGVGVGAAFLTARFMTTLLFGVSPTDLRTMVERSPCARRDRGHRVPRAGAAGRRSSIRRRSCERAECFTIGK